MKYAIWFVRLVFAAWMVPAGLNHFIPLFPQPMGNEPLSQELIAALLGSHLFTLVKTVELLTGLAVLTGFYMPLMLVACMPVSFCVWYWDTPLQGWGSVSSIFGWAVLLCDVFLLLAYVRGYRALFVLNARPRWPEKRQLVLAGRLIFGVWMVVNGLNHFAGALYAEPAGHTPLAIQLMSALADSRLLDVAMAIQVAAGALIVAGAFVPLALMVVIPVNVCAAFWAVILEHQPLGGVLALIAVALNALLMLAYLDSYDGVLRRRAIALGEAEGDGRNFDRSFALPIGRISPAQFGAALAVLVLAAAFYHFLVPGLTGQFALLTLAYPAIVLVARLVQGFGGKRPVSA
jgi:hypothetical protein